MNASHTPRLLVCYDGSQASKQAITTAGASFPAAHAVILNVWQPVERLGFSYMGVSGDVGDINATVQRASEHTADEGASLARQAGLDAQAENIESHGSVDKVIIDRCDQRDCDIVVVGTSGHSLIAGALLGSVSNAVIHQSSIPVFIVRPEPAPTTESTADRHAAAASGSTT